MNYKVLIVDDEEPARILLQKHVEKVPHLELVGTCSNAFDALEILSKQLIDILLLDIQMSQLTGLDLLRTLDRQPATILTTAFSEFALEGFELDVVDYLLKPITFQRFFKAIVKAKRVIGISIPSNDNFIDESVQTNFSLQSPTFIFLKIDTKWIKFQLDNIYYLESFGEYIKIHADSGVKLTLGSLQKMETILPISSFYRIHRTFMINVSKIDSIEGNMVRIRNRKLPISRQRKEELFDIYISNKK